jgi:hypothetical protein
VRFSLSRRMIGTPAVILRCSRTGTSCIRPRARPTRHAGAAPHATGRARPRCT